MEPAFPHLHDTCQRIDETEHWPGISKLEFFAAAALPCVHDRGGRYGPDGAAQVAKYSFDIAAAMLAESERRSK